MSGFGFFIIGGLLIFMAHIAALGIYAFSTKILGMGISHRDEQGTYKPDMAVRVILLIMSFFTATALILSLYGMFFLTTGQIY